MAWLRHVRTVPPPLSHAGVQYAGGPTRRHVHPVIKLVAGLRPSVCCRRFEHVFHGNRLHPTLPREREALGRPEAPLGAHRPQPEARLRGAAVSETGRAGTGPGSVVRPHRVTAVHPATAAHDTSLSSQLITVSPHHL